jgi:hypothetical protein
MCILKIVVREMHQEKGGDNMTNTELLEKKIQESGKKKSYLAKRCGLSRAGFRNCMINKSEFKTSQVDILCEELGITSLKEKDLIFFAKRGA